MVDPVDLETNVLEFLKKSFMFVRLERVGDREVVLFQRTETESEARFRPRILRLSLLVPGDWVLLDLAADRLVLGQDGRTPGPRGAGTALEAGAEGTEFEEQGIRFEALQVPGGRHYVPVELAERLTAAGVLERFGLERPLGR